MRTLHRALLWSWALAGITYAYQPTFNDTKAPNPQNCPGYQASKVKTSASGLTASLQLAGDACNAFGTDVDDLTLTVEWQHVHRLSVNIEPTYLGSSNRTEYVLDSWLVAEPSGSTPQSRSDLGFSWGNDPSFWFQVTRKSTGDVIFDTKGHKLVFENQFLEVVANLPSDYHISGLGERLHGLALEPGFVAASWASDFGTLPDVNLYGSHPFYLETRYQEDGDAHNHGVYFRNAHGQEAIFRDRDMSWRWIGGTIDLYFFDGPSVEDVTNQYQNVIGLPVMQQYWTLGFHQCRWGYSGWEEIQRSIANYAKHNIPLETQWVDIDYMWQYRDFTLDSSNESWSMAQRDATLKTLRSHHQHFVPIIDSGIKYEPHDNRYPTYSKGSAMDLYIKNPDNTYFVGIVWPGAATFVDWHHPESWAFWTEQLSDFYKDVLEFDGIWIDMSEPANFCEGSCGTSTPQAGPIGPGQRNINEPPYKLNLAMGNIDRRTVSMNATHHGGHVEYDVHNLFGYQLLNATYQGVLQTLPGKRPFVIGRSTFAGSGKWAGHWGGDNYATWESMASSIGQGLTMSLFGISMFGVDVCGFADDSSEQLCGRWMQLGAFFPFYRNHYAEAALPHEAWRWPSVAEYSASIMKIRYSLLPYIYTLLYQASQSGSNTMRALSWEFPRDPSLFGVDTQFLLGPSLMVIPVLTEDATSVSGVFPSSAIWYDWYNQTSVAPSTAAIEVDAPQGHLPLYIRGGSILPLQAPAMTVYESRQGHWSLIVALDQDGQASGSVYLDDGESINPSQQQHVMFSAQSNNLKVHSVGSYDFEDYGVSPPPLDTVTILGVSKTVSTVTFNGQSVKAEYDERKHSLVIGSLVENTKGGAWSLEWTLDW